MRTVTALLLGLALWVPAVRADGDEDPEPPSRGDVVVLKTNHGTVKIELNRKQAPLTVKNFLRYVDEKVYDGTLFHRVINDFMIQGGGYKKGIAQARQLNDLEMAGYEPIKNESKNGLSNKRGTISMARTSDPDSGKSQFFINVKDNVQLDAADGKPGYCVFGKVVAGMDVVDKIKAVKTRQFGGFADVPVEEVIVETARRGR